MTMLAFVRVGSNKFCTMWTCRDQMTCSFRRIRHPFQAVVTLDRLGSQQLSTVRARFCHGALSLLLQVECFVTRSRVSSRELLVEYPDISRLSATDDELLFWIAIFQ